jgi:hypothetical protein
MKWWCQILTQFDIISLQEKLEPLIKVINEVLTQNILVVEYMSFQRLKNRWSMLWFIFMVNNYDYFYYSYFYYNMIKQNKFSI